MALDLSLANYQINTPNFNKIAEDSLNLNKSMFEDVKKRILQKALADSINPESGNVDADTFLKLLKSTRLPFTGEEIEQAHGLMLKQEQTNRDIGEAQIMAEATGTKPVYDAADYTKPVQSEKPTPPPIIPVGKAPESQPTTPPTPSEEAPTKSSIKSRKLSPTEKKEVRMYTSQLGGAKGVEKYQRELNDELAKFGEGPIKVDGLYGSITLQAKNLLASKKAKAKEVPVEDSVEVKASAPTTPYKPAYSEEKIPEMEPPKEDTLKEEPSYPKDKITRNAIEKQKEGSVDFTLAEDDAYFDKAWDTFVKNNTDNKGNIFGISTLNRKAMDGLKEQYRGVYKNGLPSLALTGKAEDVYKRRWNIQNRKSDREKGFADAQKQVVADLSTLHNIDVADAATKLARDKENRNREENSFTWNDETKTFAPKDREMLILNKQIIETVETAKKTGDIGALRQALAEKSSGSSGTVSTAALHGYFNYLPPSFWDVVSSKSTIDFLESGLSWIAKNDPKLRVKFLDTFSKMATINIESIFYRGKAAKAKRDKKPNVPSGAHQATDKDFE